MTTYRFEVKVEAEIISEAEVLGLLNEILMLNLRLNFHVKPYKKEEKQLSLFDDPKFEHKDES